MTWVTQRVTVDGQPDCNKHTTGGDVPYLLQLPRSKITHDVMSPGLRVTVYLHETLSKDKTDMRLVFNTTLTVDVSANDDELRAAFIELVTMKAREVYGPAAMLAKSRPALSISLTDRGGMNMLDVFEITLAHNEQQSSDLPLE